MVRWRDQRRSENVEDRRGRASRMGTPIKVGGGAGLLLLLAFVVLGGDPSVLLQGGGGDPGPTAPPPADDQAAQFTSAMLASTEDVWRELFRREGATYREPVLVLFDDAVRSACGFSSSATGPFYCPGDEKLYLDLGFFRQLAQLGGPGDFAAAYVVGHEVGHHVQRLTGIADRVRRAQSAASGQAEANRLQVLMELQADCLSGVWAHHAERTRGILEPGDVDEGLRAAEAIGDDRLTRGAGRRVAPESFTHGTAEQRREWLSRGIETGDPDACDTFGRAGVGL